MGLRHFFQITQFFSLIIGLHLGRHLGYIEMLNDARVASLGIIKDIICTTRINKEKKFKIKFQVLLKFAKILLDYTILFMEQISFSLKLFSDFFYGQTFIKTVRGPYSKALKSH